MRCNEGVLRPLHHIRVTASMRADLEVWASFLQHYNGVSFWRQEVRLEAQFQLSSDASGSYGFGVILKDHWCAHQWPRRWRESAICRDLTFLELFPIAVAVCLWAEVLANSTAHFWCDNFSTVQIINSLSSRNPWVMNLVRFITARCLQFNIVFYARHVPGLDNGIADSLSRNQISRF